MRMTGLRRILQNPRAVLLLYAQELAVFLVLFVLLTVYLRSVAGRSYYAWDLDLSFLVKVFNNPGALGILGLIVLAAAVFFILCRLFFMGGIFEVLAYSWDGLPSFFRSARQHVLKFILLALVYILVAGIVWGLAAFLFGRIGNHVSDSRWPFVSLFLKGAAAYLILTPVAFLHASSRFLTVRRRAFPSVSVFHGNRCGPFTGTPLLIPSWRFSWRP